MAKAQHKPRAAPETKAPGLKAAEAGPRNRLLPSLVWVQRE